MAKRKPTWQPFYCPTHMRMPHCAGYKGREKCDKSFHNNPCAEKIIIDYFFQDTLKFESVEAGYRSGSWSWWRSATTGILYPVTLGEMTEVIKRTENGGEVTATWQIKKKGANFTLAIPEKKDMPVSVSGGVFGT